MDPNKALSLSPPSSSRAHDTYKTKRVPVVPSMLWTYAHMRGRNEHYFDPLHHALYPASNRELFAHRMWLPPIAKRASLEGLHKGSIFFWDPVTFAHLQPPQQLPPALHNGNYKPRRNRQVSLTYDKFIRQNPPSIGMNHYKGDMVYANFGYYLAEGKWVDPESEGELFDAYMNPPSSSIAGPNLPSVHKYQDTGPRIMSALEEEEFYKDFVADVSDENDGEGDPRVWRISPSNFALWATGAVAGDQYEEVVMQTPAKLPNVRRNMAQKGAIPSRKQLELQFDIETGSLLSGIYETERSPALLQSPLGVDIIRPPPAFNYSYPQVMHELERHGFGPAWCDRRQRGTFPPSIVSTPEIFTSECARKNLAYQEDPLSGYGEYECAKEGVFRLREEVERGWVQNIAQMQKVQEAAEKRIELSRQIFFLKFHLEQTLKAVNPTLVMKIPATLKDMPRAPSPPSPTPQRGQYRRYLDEAEEHGNLQVARTKLLGARLKSEYQEILDDLRLREKEKSELLEKLGVKSVRGIPGLIPRRKVSSENLRGEYRGQWQNGTSS